MERRQLYPVATQAEIYDRSSKNLGGWHRRWGGNNVDNVRFKFPSCAVGLLQRTLGAPVSKTTVEMGKELESSVSLWVYFKRMPLTVLSEASGAKGFRDTNK